MRFLPAITTTRPDWKKKIKEASAIGLDSVCFFLTCLKEVQRNEFYRLAGKSGLKAPFVHLRSDMKPEEIRLLKEKFGAEIFNIHSYSEYPEKYNYTGLKDLIYIENIYNPLNSRELKKFGGICLDFAHLENDRLTDAKK